jgi:hypothetical protein
MCETASGKKVKILCVVPRKKRIAALEENPDIVIIYETKDIYFRCCLYFNFFINC